MCHAMVDLDGNGLMIFAEFVSDAFARLTRLGLTKYVGLCVASRSVYVHAFRWVSVHFLGVLVSSDVS